MKAVRRLANIFGTDKLLLSNVGLTRLQSRSCKSEAGVFSATEQERAIIDRIIRVNQAGELGADRIYAGQLAVLKNTDVGPVIKEMWEQEKEHLETFNKLIPHYRARPTALLPLWSVAGWLLGAGTAVIGKEGAMACTVAVESVIGEHYNDQIRELVALNPEKYKDLLQTLTKFRDEELHHHDTGLKHDAERAPMYAALTEVIKFGCRTAIWVAERI